MSGKSTEETPATHPREHCGVFTIGHNIPVQGAWRDITYQPVAHNIWTASEGIYRTIFLEGKKGCIAFDTLTTPGTARAYGAGIGRVFPGKPVHTIVYSHDHLDHTGYAADLAPHADIIAHDYANKVIAGRRSDGQLPATEVWSGERKAYRIDGCDFEMIYPGPTHGDGNAAAYFPQNRVLFMVDTVAAGVGYCYLMDWHLAPYIAVMRRFLSLDWDIFVPGHFWILTRQEFIDILDYWERQIEFAQQAVLDDINPHDMDALKGYTDEKSPAADRNLFRFHEYAAINLSRYMQEYLCGGWGIEGNFVPDTSPL
jgi:glyoxylase-like metal-dependent hydrolase (beta-lactamase superfamily II)